MKNHRSFATVAALCVATLAHPSAAAEFINSTSWTQTEPGAGGAFVTIGAGPSGIVLAAADVSGTYITSNPGGTGATWTNIGNAQGVTFTHNSAVGFHRSNSTIM